MLHKLRKYALVTAVKNEEKYIEETIKSVINQEVKPEKWVIVDDNSTDATTEIIGRYSLEIPYIQCIKNKASDSRDFASKARALRCAFEQLHLPRYSFIGNLDGDLSFGSDFYRQLMSFFDEDQSLGCIGGTIWEYIDGKWKFNHQNPEWCVGGATQFYRREIIEKIGVYPELRYGGEDTVMEYIVRDMGYKVKAFRQLPVKHHKPTGPEFGNGLKKSFLLGRQEYLWGTAPVFQIFKCIKRVRNKPLMIGALSRISGYFSCYLFGRCGSVPLHIRRMIRRQQHKRLVLDLRKSLQRLFSHSNCVCPEVKKK